MGPFCVAVDRGAGLEKVLDYNDRLPGDQGVCGGSLGDLAFKDLGPRTGVWAEPVTLDALDGTLATCGYVRIGEWRKRVTAAGKIRFFADAVTRLEALNS